MAETGGVGDPARMLRLGAVVVVFLGVLGFVIFGIKSSGRSAAQQCYDTEAEDDGKQWASPEEFDRLHHLAYDFVSCRDGCEDGKDAYSCRNVAYIYSLGKGLRYEGKQDYEKAAQYARKSCDISATSPCVMEGRYQCYQNEDACEERCRNGAGTDCVSLAKKFDRPGKTNDNPQRAQKLHQLACDAGVDDSCVRGAALLCAAQPVECSTRCKEGDALLCFKLGEVLGYGSSSVSKNPAKASEFKRKACELDPNVSEHCSRILTEAEISL